MDNTQNSLVFAFDGDEIGKRHAKAILSDNLDKVREVSDHITEGNDYIRQFVESNGGQWVSGGGDEGAFTAPAEFVDLLEQLRKDYEYLVQATLSIGYGETISQAGKALLVAKEHGKDQVVQYDQSMEQELAHIQGEHTDEESEEKKKIKAVLASDESKDEQFEETETEEQTAGSANQDSDEDEGVGHDQVLPAGSDKAINEPTLCEPPKYDNNLGYDSGYKDDSPEQREESYQAQDFTSPIIKKPNLTPKPRVEEAVSTDIQEATRPMNTVLPDPKDVEPQDKKQAPKEYHGQAEGDENMDSKKEPESMAQPREDKPGTLKYSTGEQGQPSPFVPEENATSDEAEQIESQDMNEDKHCPSCTCSAGDESAENILDQHLDNYKDFTNTIGEGGNSGTEGAAGQSESTENVLDQHIDNANEMGEMIDDQGVIRPEDYGQKDQDMGLSEEEADGDEPALDEVLRGGLDAHADSIQKEKVLNMVGEALEGFKAQKAILDKAKEQAPELYASCISMLKAMIELCSLAGIDEGQAEQDVNEIEGQGESPEEVPGEEDSQSQEKGCPNCGHSSEQQEKEMPKEASPKSPQQ